MQLKSQLAHLPSADKRRVESIRASHVENTAKEAQRGRLRSKSINASEVVKYDQLERAQDPRLESGPPAKKRRIEPTPSGRLEALRLRLAQRKPTRYDDKKWLDYKNNSINQLQRFYPNSTPLNYCHI